jgi:hypothetical protein
MAAKVRVNEAGVMWMALIDTEELLGVVVDELLHAAARRPSVQTPAVITSFLLICLKETTLFSESSQRSLPATWWRPDSDRSGPGSFPPTLGGCL